MSRHYYVYCRTCDDRHEYGQNHGLEQMRAWVRHAATLGAGPLTELLRDGKASVSLMVWNNSSVDTSWFYEHQSHALAVIDEYGRVDGDCTKRATCSQCGHESPCRLPLDHRGECSPVDTMRAATPKEP